MNRRLLRLLLWITFASSLMAAPQFAHAVTNLKLFSAEERAWIAAHPVVHIAVDPDWRPLEYVEDGVHKGLTSEYVQAIAAITGRSGAENSDKRLSGNSAQMRTRDARIRSRNETYEKKSHSGLQGQGRLGSYQGREDAGRTGRAI
jgi:hypothetical protein